MEAESDGENWVGGKDQGKIYRNILVLFSLVNGGNIGSIVAWWSLTSNDDFMSQIVRTKGGFTVNLQTYREHRIPQDGDIGQHREYLACNRNDGKVPALGDRG